MPIQHVQLPEPVPRACTGSRMCTPEPDCAAGTSSSEQWFVQFLANYSRIRNAWKSGTPVPCSTDGDAADNAGFAPAGSPGFLAEVARTPDPWFSRPSEPAGSSDNWSRLRHCARQPTTALATRGAAFEGHRFRFPNAAGHSRTAERLPHRGAGIAAPYGFVTAFFWLLSYYHHTIVIRLLHVINEFRNE